MAERVWYLYCIAGGSGAPTLPQPLMAVSWADLHAVLSPVDPEEFQGLEPGPDGAIPGALAELLLHHDAVVRQVFAAHPTLPIRFGTALPDPGAALALLQDRQPLLQEQLDRVRDHAEWGVRWRYAPPSRAGGTQAAPEGGRAYLQSRSRQLQEGREAERRFRAQVRAAHAGLAELAAEFRVADQPPGSHETACTYLVRTERAAEFCALAAEGGAHLTGPWPPYSFCSPLEEVEPVRGG